MPFDVLLIENQLFCKFSKSVLNSNDDTCFSDVFTILYNWYNYQILTLCALFDCLRSKNSWVVLQPSKRCARMLECCKTWGIWGLRN